MDFEGGWETIAWSDDFITGHSDVDSDHRKLLALFNEFSIRVSARQGDIAVHDMLEELKDYTLYHFSREERLMQESSYPEYERHKKMHDTFTRQVDDVGYHLAAGSDISAFLLSFLAKWLSGHILSADRKLVNFLVGEGFANP